jgi:hypothetical protein
VYDPVAERGQRYKRTAAYTNIFRAYHGTAILTSYGDILVSGEGGTSSSCSDGNKQQRQ